MTADESASILRSDIQRGISSREAGERLSIFGLNALEQKREKSSLIVFLRQLKSPLILILLGAAVVTLAISHFRDALFILIAVVINTALGFYQEYKAEKALAELNTYLRQRTRVIREGVEADIDAEYLVPGDLIRIMQGDRVPADARIAFENDLEVDEAILTGESIAAEKSADPSLRDAGLGDQHSILFAGTLVTQGTATAIVCRTDNATEFGKIAALVAGADAETTPLQVAIRKFSLRASGVLGFLTVVIFFIGVSSGHSYLEMFLTSVAIAVSAIPEGLPVALTVILAVGVQRMAKRNGVVRKLIAAEALGSATVILTDKTGTLTMAKMELSNAIPIGNIEENELIKQALVNANVVIENPADTPDQWHMSGPIMETTLVRSAALRGIQLSDQSRKDMVDQSLPFNSNTKFSVSLVREGEKHKLLFFGAPDILVAQSASSGSQRDLIQEKIEALAYEGKRVLGIASREINPTADFSLARDLVPDHLSFNGLLAFRDPVRPGVKGAIARVERAGIKTIIMTGDHRGTAETIAREVGLPVKPGSVIEASALSTMSDEELIARLQTIRVIARVTPLDKMRIVEMLQHTGEVVAMTGDGVNDAPSIKQADIGIAMGSGTEVSRSVADLVLLDDNFETIAAAVDEGRRIIGNVRKVIVYLLSTVLDELLLIGGALITGVPLPLNALQILWVNFFSDSFPAIAFAFEKEGEGLAGRAHSARAGLFDPLMRFLILGVGLMTSVLLFALYFLLLHLQFEDGLVRTFIFACFGTYSLFLAFSLRSLEKSIFSYPVFSNPYLVFGVGVGLTLMAAAVYMPLLQSLFGTIALPPLWLAAVVVVGVANIAAIEFGKWMYARR